MSALIAVTTAVTASPLPSPEVITKVVQVAVTPQWVFDAANLLLLVVPGYAASFIHSLVNDRADGSNRFKSWFNAGLLFLYSGVLTVLALLVQGQLNLQNINWGNPELVIGSFFTVLGAAAARYAVIKAREQAPAPAPTTTDTTITAPIVTSTSTTDTQF